MNNAVPLPHAVDGTRDRAVAASRDFRRPIIVRTE
jgi:hypothetical protein